MFVSSHVPGSVHDYDLHKQIYHTYGEYLRMSEEEVARLEDNVDPPFWPVMGDKEYTGPDHDTEPIKRIVPAKGPLLNQHQRARNLVINRKRVVVEGFFGRLCNLWAVFRNTWRYDRASFDEDFTIACLLTNEHKSKCFDWQKRTRAIQR